jgi:hypothetical protein
MRADQGDKDDVHRHGSVSINGRRRRRRDIAVLSTSSDTFLREVDLLSQLDHANLSCLCAVERDQLYFIQEHSHFGTLHDYSRTLLNHQSTVDGTFHK